MRFRDVRVAQQMLRSARIDTRGKYMEVIDKLLELGISLGDYKKLKEAFKLNPNTRYLFIDIHLGVHIVEECDFLSKGWVELTPYEVLSIRNDQTDRKRKIVKKARIRVNNEVESLQVQELLNRLGYHWGKKKLYLKLNALEYNKACYIHTDVYKKGHLTWSHVTDEITNKFERELTIEQLSNI